MFVAETLAVLATTLFPKDILEGRDIVWFVDNIGGRVPFWFNIVCDVERYIPWSSIEDPTRT